MGHVGGSWAIGDVPLKSILNSGLSLLPVSCSLGAMIDSSAYHNLPLSSRSEAITANYETRNQNRPLVLAGCLLSSFLRVWRNCLCESRVIERKDRNAHYYNAEHTREED